MTNRGLPLLVDDGFFHIVTMTNRVDFLQAIASAQYNKLNSTIFVFDTPANIDALITEYAGGLDLQRFQDAMSGSTMSRVVLVDSRYISAYTPLACENTVAALQVMPTKFCDARNFMHTFLRHDPQGAPRFVLHKDSDEYFLEWHKPLFKEFRDYVENNPGMNVLAANINIFSYYRDEARSQAHMRTALVHISAEWSQYIHENIEAWLHSVKGKVAFTAIGLCHEGYNKGEHDMKEKAKRNIYLSCLQLVDAPEIANNEMFMRQFSEVLKYYNDPKKGEKK